MENKIVTVPSYLKRLDDKQRVPAMDLSGPIRVIADAGSGKTTTFVCRLEHMFHSGIPPYQVLATTFTKKAANEMKERLEKRLRGTDVNLKGFTIGTMHSIASRIIRQYGSCVGIPDNYTILDEDDAKSLLDKLIKDHVGKDSKIKAKDFIYALSFSRNAMIPLWEAMESMIPQFSSVFYALEQVAHEYAAIKLKMATLDFDDLLEKWHQIMATSAEARTVLQERWSYVMIDEYQDTNVLQNEIVKMMCAKHRNIFVVGDDKQSIYKFRAAEVRNFLDFERVWKGCKTYFLNTNYRSTPEIIAAAAEVIRNNRGQIHREVGTPNRSGHQPMLYYPSTDIEQDFQIVRAIQFFHDKGVPYDEMMVLYRNNRQPADLERRLVRAMIPFYKKGGKFWQSAHLKLAVCWLRLLQNQMDKTSLARIILTYPGLGQGAVDKALDLIESPENLVQFMNGELSVCKPSAKVYASWSQIAKDMKGMFDAYHSGVEKPLYQAALHVAQICRPHVMEKMENPADRLEDFDSLTGLAEEFETIEEMLEEIALQDDRQNENQKRVLLSTIHGVKGLEAKVVFIMGLNEEIFPGFRAETEEDIEEERRLMYVGMTRAKEMLVMYCPLQQAKPGRTQGPLTRSRFLDEIPEEMLRVRNS